MEIKSQKEIANDFFSKKNVIAYVKYKKNQ